MTQLPLNTVFGLGVALLTSSVSSAATLTLNMNNVEVDQGEIRIAVFNSEETFTIKPSHIMGAASRSETVTVTFDDLPVGEYAVMLYQDTNNNEELDTNLLGIPKEPWGGSLNGSAVFGAPKWKDVKFEVPESGATIDIKLH